MVRDHTFYGGNDSRLGNIHPMTDHYAGIGDPRDLYDALTHLWAVDTCAPRLREKWTGDNPTLGQCSVTAFLAQDVFGGEVRGIRRPAGSFHCYNVVDGVVFDLTSEQFGGEVLDYEDNPEQSRDAHFAKAEKKARYELLKTRLEAWCRRVETSETTERQDDNNGE